MGQIDAVLSLVLSILSIVSGFYLGARKNKDDRGAIMFNEAVALKDSYKVKAEELIREIEQIKKQQSVNTKKILELVHQEEKCQKALAKLERNNKELYRMLRENDERKC